MNKEIPEEVLFDIEMKSYMKYNHIIASMYDYLGEIYSSQDIEDVKSAQKYFEEQLKEDYLNGKLVYTEEDLKKIRESWIIDGED